MEAWKRVSHPSQVLAVGDTVKVQIVKINPETQRISLGMKPSSLQSDPWDGVEDQGRIPGGRWKFKGRITNITDYWRLRWSWKPASRAWCTSPK